MESTSAKNEEEDLFFDAVDDFPFHDCISSDQSDLSTAQASTLPLHEPHATKCSLDTSSPASAFRRRSLARRRMSDNELKVLSSDSATNSELSIFQQTKTSFRDRRYSIGRQSRRKEEGNEKSESIAERVSSVRPAGSLSEQNNEESTVTTANDDGVGDAVDSAAELGEASSSNFLVFIADLVIKAIGFQINLLISFITFPIWVLYSCYVFVFDPFGTMRRALRHSFSKFHSLGSLMSDNVSPFIFEWLKEHKLVWTLALRFGCGFLWAVYVCIVLCGLLLSSLLVSGFIVRFFVEEPTQIKEKLNFDYTKSSPIAFAPVISCACIDCGEKCSEQTEIEKSIDSRVVPPNRKLQVAVSLILPESEYNRNLGMFQVRVHFLSATGEILASSSHPCMLKFKSEPIRLLLTFLEVAPLVAGFMSESQTLNLKFGGFTEQHIPTACLKVIIEQRAEYPHGAGIPEIYDASIVFESELPLFKRIIWYWKKTMFVWTSMTLFMMELLFTLLCCRPLIIPGARHREDYVNNNASQNSSPAQRSKFD